MASAAGEVVARSSRPCGLTGADGFMQCHGAGCAVERQLFGASIKVSRGVDGNQAVFNPSPALVGQAGKAANVRPHRGFMAVRAQATLLWHLPHLWIRQGTGGLPYPCCCQLVPVADAKRGLAFMASLATSSIPAISMPCRLAASRSIQPAFAPAFKTFTASLGCRLKIGGF